MTPGETDFSTLVAIAGLTCVTIVTRCFFFLSNAAWSLPSWIQRGLQYAPIAALTAVIIPEVMLTQGVLTAFWMDARFYAAIAGVACFFWRKNVLWTIVSGMAVYLPLHIGLGW